MGGCGEAAEDADPGSCEVPPGDEEGGQSFTAATRVLLASGKTIPISQLKVGGKVKAVDTKTGKGQVKTVQAVLVHYDTDLYDLTVKTARGTEAIDTTTNHLFWDPARRGGSRPPSSPWASGSSPPTAPRQSPTAATPQPATTAGCGT